ncbi:hypothetical protein [Acidovorax sp. PRC11]|uniref:hypothetical protein n=1 Tax=Acidovorax sp. PRC11 TaxID=2962592 RepID=UPI0028811ED3|nr:hypothetical protein [Acidovorax sp. PRC11]MDT0137249.1 hypothetical protein [Acidovorax sp. PRC11]
MKDLPTAMLAGLFGALISAFLSYIVRLRAKRKEDEEERKRIAKVNFLLLTNTVAFHHFASQLIASAVKKHGFSDSRVNTPHAAAVVIGSAVADLKTEDTEGIRVFLKPFLVALAGELRKFEVKQSDLAKMSEVAIFMYHRFNTTASRLVAGLNLLDELLENGDPKKISASYLLSLYETYKSFAHAAGVLRAAFQESAGLEKDYAFDCFERAFTVIQKETVTFTSQSAKLQRLLHAIQEATPSQTSGPADQFADR